MAFAPTQSMMALDRWEPLLTSVHSSRGPQQRFMAQTQMPQSSSVSTALAALVARLHALQWTVMISSSSTSTRRCRQSI